jgi:hypothetical protein
VGQAAQRRACEAHDQERRRLKLVRLVMQGLLPEEGADAAEMPGSVG